MILRVTEVVNTDPAVVAGLSFPNCRCLLTDKRVAKRSNGIQVLVKQCLECGRSLGAISKKNHDLSKYKQFEESLRVKHQEDRKKFYDERFLEERKQRVNSVEWWARYHEHIESAKWKAIREKVLARDCYTCRGCGTKRAQQVNHLTYDHLGNELLFELVAICVDCHRIIHPDMGK